MKKLPKRIITQRISEFQAMQRRRGSVEPPGSSADGAGSGPSGPGRLLETALFLEDVFGIEISDTEMSLEQLGMNADLTDFVVRKMGQD